MLLHGVVLVVDHSDVIAIFERTVVIERGKAGEIWPDRCLADPPVEVHDIGMIFLHEFRAPCEPVVGPCRRDVSEVIVERECPSW